MGKEWMDERERERERENTQGKDEKGGEDWEKLQHPKLLDPPLSFCAVDDCCFLIETLSEHIVFGVTYMHVSYAVLACIACRVNSSSSRCSDHVLLRKSSNQAVDKLLNCLLFCWFITYSQRFTKAFMVHIKLSLPKFSLSLDFVLLSH